MKSACRLIAMTIARTTVCLLLLAITIGFGLYSAKAVNWVMPLNGLTKSSGYSGFIPNRVISESSNTAAHLSQDYISSTGQWDVMAIYGGKVIVVRNSLSDGAGRYVIIQHTIGSATVYSEYQHLKSISVSNGDSVSAGQVIGVGGQSGTSEEQYGRHLHIAIYTGVQDAWAPRLTQYAQNTVYDGPIEYAGTTYYNPDRVLHGLSVILGTEDPDPASNFRFKDVTYPKTFKIDTTYGWSLGSGIVESNYSLTSIRSEILNSSGGSVSDSGVKVISGYSYSIKSLDDYSGTNNGVRFSWINSEGNYTWRLTATDSGGRTLAMDMPFSAVNGGSTVTSTMGKEYSEAYLDLNGLLDGSSSGDISGYGTADVYINGSLVADDVDDYYSVWPTGTQYEIRDIRAAAGHAYNGFEGNLSGTVGSTTTQVVLNFSTIRVTGVTLDHTELTLEPNHTATLAATITPSDALDQAVNWTSSDTSVVEFTVSGSNPHEVEIKALESGTSRITCTTNDGNKTATCTVTVKIPVTSISLSNIGLTLVKGESATLTAAISPSNATNKNVIWNSDNTAVATVSDGVVRAVGAGSATITCSAADDNDIKATCSVIVIEEIIPDFILPNSLKEIGEEAFTGIDARCIVVPDGVETIGKKAFADCVKLEQITIPASTTTIARDAFADAPSGFTIHGMLNSHAQIFASENGIRFVADDACTITFNANGGAGSETSRMIKKGTAIGTLPTASKSNNTLDGWYTSASDGTQVTASTVFNEDTTVYAHWTRMTCTITFDANGGSCSTSTEIVNKGEAIGTLPIPARTYYGFQGWYTQQSGGSAITVATTFSQDQTLYARWEMNGFGNWSEWSTTPVTGNDNREVQSEVRSVQTGTKTIYNYNRFLYWRPEKGYYQASYGSNWATSNGYSGSWQYLSTESRLPVDHTTDGQNVYLGEVRDGNKWWYNESTTTEPIYGNVTYYRYRDRIQ